MELCKKYWSEAIKEEYESVLNGDWKDWVEKYQSIDDNGLYDNMVEWCTNDVLNNDYLWLVVSEVIQQSIESFIMEKRLTK